MRSASLLTRSSSGPKWPFWPLSRRLSCVGPCDCVALGHGTLRRVLVGVETRTRVDLLAVAEPEPLRRGLDVLVAAAGEVHQQQGFSAEFLAEHQCPGQGVRRLDRRDDA